jgi:ubiquinone/menaquinone biosynthesis C-methylase UbiE
MGINPRRPYFNNLAAEWDHLPGPPDVDKIRYFVQRSLYTGVSRILDIGCGTGVLLPVLLDSCRDLSCLVELDFAIDMLRVNSAKFPDSRIGRVCADALRMPFADASFDLVLCFGILPHLDDKPAAISQIFGILRSGGILCVGHLMGSDELNAFHKNLTGPVSGDSLPTIATLTEMLRNLGALEILAEENPNWYFLRAIKP